MYIWFIHWKRGLRCSWGGMLTYILQKIAKNTSKKSLGLWGDSLTWSFHDFLFDFRYRLFTESMMESKCMWTISWRRNGRDLQPLAVIPLHLRGTLYSVDIWWTLMNSISETESLQLIGLRSGTDRLLRKNVIFYIRPEQRLIFLMRNYNIFAVTKVLWSHIGHNFQTLTFFLWFILKPEQWLNLMKNYNYSKTFRYIHYANFHTKIRG